MTKENVQTSAALDWYFQSPTIHSDVSQEPWRTLSRHGIEVRFRCVAWALVAPGRIGSLDHVLIELGRALRYDYSAESTRAILRWWCALHGFDADDKRLLSVSLSRPSAGQPCIWLEGAKRDRDRLSCNAMYADRPRRDEEALAKGLPVAEEDNFDGPCDIISSQFHSDSPEMSSPLDVLAATGRLNELSQREIRLYAHLWVETQRLAREPGLPWIPYVMASLKEIESATGMDKAREPAESLAKRGLIEYEKGELGMRSKFHVVFPVPCPRECPELAGSLLPEAQTATPRVPEPADEAETAKRVMDELMRLSEDAFSGDGRTKLTSVGISEETGRRFELRHISPVAVTTLAASLDALGVSPLDLQRLGLTVRMGGRLVLHAKPYFVIESASGGMRIRAFGIRKGQLKPSSGYPAHERGFNLDATSAERFVVCRNFAEALVVESVGFPALCGVPERKVSTPPYPNFRAHRAWEGKRIVLSWTTDDGEKSKLPPSFAFNGTGALWTYAQQSASDFIEGGDVAGLRDMLDKAFSRLGTLPDAGHDGETPRLKNPSGRSASSPVLAHRAAARTDTQPVPLSSIPTP